MPIKVILTGATGMVGEGVLLECLQHPEVMEVLIIGRRHYDMTHPKLKELLVKDFTKLNGLDQQLSGFDACLYCAGITSVGMSEADYTHITYDIPLSLANKLLSLNPNMVFSHISGGSTDSTEKGKVMWARVKGKAENALMKLPFRKVYNFRPGLMKATKGQKNLQSWYFIVAVLYPVMRIFIPGKVLLLRDVGLAMINSVIKGYPKSILEVPDIQALAKA